MRALGEVRDDDDGGGFHNADKNLDFRTPSVTELFNNELITRAPDKMIGFYHILIVDFDLNILEINNHLYEKNRYIFPIMKSAN